MEHWVVFQSVPFGLFSVPPPRRRMAVPVLVVFHLPLLVFHLPLLVFHLPLLVFQSVPLLFHIGEHIAPRPDSIHPLVFLRRPEFEHDVFQAGLCLWCVRMVGQP